ncbi:potassium-transporting ATPase subunit KdpB, partial [Chryseosolibacter indicus]
MTRKRTIKLFEAALVNTAVRQAFVKLNPKLMVKNPVMFTVEISTLIMLIVVFHQLITGDSSQGAIWYNVTVFIILLVTVLFANFAEALAEARGKAQAESLRKTREETKAKKIINDTNQVAIISSSQLRKGDLFICEAGDIIPNDGEIIEGIATVDESAITGESAPVIREAGGDKSSVTGGTKVLSDKIKVRVTTSPGETFLDKIIALVEGASRQKTPNEIALTILLATFTLIFLIVCVALKPYADYAGTPITIAAFISLFVCLIPTTIGGLLSAIGIAGMDRALGANVIAKSGKAVETAGDVDVLLLDKTGTITIGNRKATSFHPVNGIPMDDLIECATIASLSDETPEGKSIVELAASKGYKHPVMVGSGGDPTYGLPNAKIVRFSAETRSSGIDLDSRSIRKGAFDAIRNLVEKKGGRVPEEVKLSVEKIAANGGTPLVVAQNDTIYGTIELQDVIKPGITERFDRLRRMGVKT